MKVVINKKLLRQEQKKKIAGRRWQEKDDFVLAVYERYKKNIITAEQLLDIFPGRTFHAIFSKVYNIRGARKVVHQKNKDPNQLELPLAGQIAPNKK